MIFKLFRFFSLVYFLTLPTGAIAQIDEHPLPPQEAFHLTLEVAQNQYFLNFQIADEYYLYHNKTSVTNPDGEALELSFPLGKKINDPFFGKSIIYEKNLDIRVINALQNGDTLLVGYQGCWKGGVCYPPQKESLIVGTGHMSVENNSSNFFDAQLRKNTLVINIFLFFGLGLLLSLTPCLLPMIPILSTLIIGSGNVAPPRRGFFLALSFVFGMSVVYALIGIAFGLLGQNLQILLQHPYAQYASTAIFVLLGLSLLGLYQIRLPNHLQGRITEAGNKHSGGGLWRSFLFGAFSAAIVSPCVTPPLAGALLYIAETGDILLGGASLFMLSLGMGTLLIIGASAVGKLPKPGPWLIKIQQVMGFLMFAIAIYIASRFLSNNTVIFLSALLATLAPITLGVLQNNKNQSFGQNLAQGIGLIILGYGVLLWILFARGGGDMLAPLASNYTPVLTEIPAESAQNIQSIQQLQNLFTAAQNEGSKLIFLDFYADWCITCKIMERTIFSNPEVLKATNGVVMTKADLTTMSPNHRDLLDHFNVFAPPAFLFFNNKGQEILELRQIGEISRKQFLKTLGRAQEITNDL